MIKLARENPEACVENFYFVPKGSLKLSVKLITRKKPLSCIAA